MSDTPEQLARRLRAGETLVWTGTPDPRKHFVPVDVVLVPFSLLWGAGAVGIPISAVIDGRASGGSLIAIPFLVVGAYFTVGRFVVKARRKRRTVYGLTGERALIAVGEGSFSQAPLAGSSLSQHRSRDGRHLTVTFGGSGRSLWSGTTFYANTGLEVFDRGTAPLGFYDVADVEGLEAALLGAGG